MSVDYDEEDCRCPSGLCPGWEARAGLENPNPGCPIHGHPETRAA